MRRFDVAVVALALLMGAGLHVVAAGASSPSPAAAASERWRWSLPAGWPAPQVPADNPMRAAKVELGRRLFYDPRLSGNGTQSCSSCHIQALAFTDGRTTAIGSTNAVHPRNTPSLVNAAYLSTLTWADPTTRTLEQQMLVPLFGMSPVEMGVTTPARRAAVLARIRRDRWYARQFRAAFPGLRAPVSWPTIMRSLGAFQRTIISARSRYDRALAGRATLTAAEQRGQALFASDRAGCQQCHGSVLFNDQFTAAGTPPVTPAFHNTGLYNVDGQGAYPAPNRGVFEVTGAPADMGRFRAPSLRGVELTAPYMHDGSIKTLEEAVAHYAAGGRVIDRGPNAGDGRANPYKDPRIQPRALSDRDRADLVAFLKTLTDRAVTRDRRLSNPFDGRGAAG